MFAGVAGTVKRVSDDGPQREAAALPPGFTRPTLPGAPGPGMAARARRVAGPTLGAVTALLVTAAGWPGAASAATHPAPPGTRPAPAGTHPAATADGQFGAPVRSVTPLAPVPQGQAALPQVAPLHHRLRADLLVVSPAALPADLVSALRGLPGVRAAEPVDAARVAVNGKVVAMLGVDPSRFRAFADRPTARDTKLWRQVAGGYLAVSYTMAQGAKLTAGSPATVSGVQPQTLTVGGSGTVGIAGVDAVVSGQVARSLGFPAGNAIVISVSNAHMTSAHLATLIKQVKATAPTTATVEQLTLPGSAPAGSAGAVTPTPASGALLSAVQATNFLRAALSRLGMPYVWGAEGPRAFDCSGLVQWSFAQAGVAMPRVAADQARTGPAVDVRHLVAGDLLFYHTDPTAPGYISHVAIYLGSGRMLQAPQPGMNVEIVPVDLGSDFAGAIAVSPQVAASLAGTAVG
jgi:peptidoglycan DL-endopeptidase CwlO